jgi:two-component system sensor histidine kinase HydH
MEDVISFVGPEIEGKNIVLHKEFGEPIELYVDPNRIKDALSNILKNAVQAVGSDGTVTIRIYEKRDVCVFEVRDTGPGISEEDLPFIFDPFFTTKKFGTGLGLTITHRIIEEHDGNITVDSRKGTGSVFRVSIPLKKEK